MHGLPAWPELVDIDLPSVHPEAVGERVVARGDAPQHGELAVGPLNPLGYQFQRREFFPGAVPSARRPWDPGSTPAGTTTRAAPRTRCQDSPQYDAMPAP